MDGPALTREEMLAAMNNSDPAYDGRFFVCVRTTGIYCFPSCTARTPKPQSVIFVRTREEAQALGFRPCKRCHSDLDGGRAQYERAVAERVRSLIDCQLPSVTAERLAAQVGFSAAHLSRLLRRQTGAGLREFIRRQRMEQAAELLRSGGQSILDIAAAVGYQSASSFYDAFQRHHGVAPGSYRSEIGKGANQYEHRDRRDRH